MGCFGADSAEPGEGRAGDGGSTVDAGGGYGDVAAAAGGTGTRRWPSPSLPPDSVLRLGSLSPASVSPGRREEKIEMHSKLVPSPQEARLEMPRIAAVTFRRRVRWCGGRTGGARAGQKLWKKRIGIPSQIVCGTSCFHLGKKKSTGKRRRRHSQKTNDGGGGGGPGGATFLFGGLLPRSHRHRIWMLLSSPPSAPRRRRSVPKASPFRNSRAISAAFWEEGLPGSFRLRYRRERRTRIQRFNPYQWFPSVCLFLSLSPSPLPLPKESLHAD